MDRIFEESGAYWNEVLLQLPARYRVKPAFGIEGVRVTTKALLIAMDDIRIYA